MYSQLDFRETPEGVSISHTPRYPDLPTSPLDPGQAVTVTEGGNDRHFDSDVSGGLPTFSEVAPRPRNDPERTRTVHETVTETRT